MDIRQAVSDMRDLYNHSCSIISREDREKYKKSLEYLVDLSEKNRERSDGEEEKGTHDN